MQFSKRLFARVTPMVAMLWLAAFTSSAVAATQYKATAGPNGGWQVNLLDSLVGSIGDECRPDYDTNTGFPTAQAKTDA